MKTFTSRRLWDLKNKNSRHIVGETLIHERMKYRQTEREQTDK